MKRRLSVSRSNIRRRNSLRLHRSLMRTDSDYRIAVFRDAGFEEIWAIVKAIISITSSILSVAKALDSSFNALKKGRGDIDKAKEAINTNSAKLKEMGGKVFTLIKDFFRLKVRFLFRIKTGSDPQEVQQ